MITHLPNADGTKVIIYVHGIGGGIDSWFNFIKYFTKNCKTNNYHHHNFTYYKLSKVKNWYGKIINTLIYLLNLIIFILKVFWSKRNDYNGKVLKEYIDKECSNAHDIILVGHSMGGLVCRKYLVDRVKNGDDISKCKMLVTYSTPHLGSDKASYVTLKRFVFFWWIYDIISKRFDYRISPQLGDLAFYNDDFIAELNKKWSQYNLEKELVFIKIIGCQDFWVTKSSASYDDNINELNKVYEYNYNHVGIINPNKVSKFPPIDRFIEAL